LPDVVRRRLEDGALSAGHARALLSAADPAALSAEIIRRGLNVRVTEQLVKRRTAQRRPGSRQARDADTIALERDLTQTLGVRATIVAKARGGTLTLHYSSLDQLDRLLALLRAG
jgi:ParB family chromosome partitioning protein